MNFAYTLVYVSDVAASLAFFERAFGLKTRFLHDSGAYGEVDTGASGIVLTFSDAEAIGVKTDGLAFHIPVSTANGNALVARARIDTLEIGAIVRRDLTVYIAQPGQLGRSLLGMSFIDTLSGFDLRGDRLILRD